LRAQVSIEFLILFGFVAASIVFPVFAILHVTSSETVSGSVNAKKANDLGNAIVQAATDQYYLGLYSRSTIRRDVPDNIEEFFILDIEKNGRNYYYLGIYLTDGTGIAKNLYLSKVPLVSTHSTIVTEDIDIKYGIPECQDSACVVYALKKRAGGQIALRIETSMHNEEEKVDIIIL
jgi:uncharacterized protein (UPF0333 family)